MRSDRIGLQEHCVALWSEREKRLDERWVAQQAATQLAFDTMLRQREEALETINRRLVLLNDLRAGVLSRSEYDAHHQILEAQVDELRSRLDADSGERTRSKDVRATMIGALALMATLAAVISPHIH